MPANTESQVDLGEREAEIDEMSDDEAEAALLAKLESMSGDEA